MKTRCSFFRHLGCSSCVEYLISCWPTSCLGSGVRKLGSVTLAALLVLMGGLENRTSLHAQEPTHPRFDTLRLPALEPDQAFKAIQVAPGLALRRVAMEPLVTDPVAACFDELGRLYVVEMRGYPFPDNTPPGRVRRLVDRDGDGTFDESSLFLDNLNWPTSVIASRGGVFVIAPPHLIYARDEDGDGRADVTRVVWTGLGTQNVQALANGLKLGPDGWIYASSGGNGGIVRRPDQPDQPAVDLRGRDFRFHPDTLQLQPIPGGGQFGHDFDTWGRRFVCNNSNHLRQVILTTADLDRLTVWPDAGSSPLEDIGVDGPAAPVFRISPPEPWRVVRTARRAADPAMRQRLPASELAVTGYFTSASGITIYQGSALPESAWGMAVVGDVGGNLVHRKRLEPQGAILQGVRIDAESELLASTDNWFRPVHFANTPWGTLLVLDMARETIEHPLSIPDDIKAQLDLKSGSDRGRIYELVPAQGTVRRPLPRFDQADHTQLVATLADPDGWRRETARRLLWERLTQTPIDHPDAAATLHALRELIAQRPSPEARVAALWTLDMLGWLNAEDLLQVANDPTAEVREVVARLARDRLKMNNPRLRTVVIDLVRDDAGMVRFQALLALGDAVPSDEPSILTALVEASERPEMQQGPTLDRWARRGLQAAVAPRLAAFLTALNQRRTELEGKRPRAATETARESERSPDDWDARLASNESWRVATLEALASSRDRRDQLAALDGLDASQATEDQLRNRWLAISRGAARSSWNPLDHPALAQRLERLAQAASQRLRASLEKDPPGPLNLDEVKLVAAAGSDASSLELLGELLAARFEPAIQVEALAGLDRRGDEEAMRWILERWRSMSPTLRSRAAEVLLNRVGRQERLNLLLEALDQARVNLSDLGPEAADRLTAAARRLGPEAHAHARQVILNAKAIDPAAKPGRLALINRYKSVLVGRAIRRPEQGRAIFQNHCATCHRLEGNGHDVGPDLATIRHRSREDVLTHILDPNREVAPTMKTYVVVTRDGRTASGILTSETDRTVSLKRSEGIVETIERDQIEEIVETGQSLMPEGLDANIDVEAMADLLDYLLPDS